MNVPFFKKKAFQQNWNAFRDKIVISGNFPVLQERFFFLKKGALTFLESVLFYNIFTRPLQAMILDFQLFNIICFTISVLYY
jgi:hypothetical protein